MSLVSVFVPCYNYARYLEGCVSSILAQDGVEVEVLIIDDASTDDSGRVARKLAAQDARVDVVCHPTNRGHIATYNEGIDWASGDYLLLLSADDELVPGALARAAAVLDRHPGVGFAFGDVPRIGEELLPLRLSGALKITKGLAWLEERCGTGYNVVPTPTAVVRTSLQRRVGGYLPDHPHAGDLEMWLRLAIYGDVAELSSHQGIYRRHNQSMSQLWSDNAAIGDLVECRRAFDEVLDSHGQELGNVRQLRSLAHRACARRMVGRASTVYESGERHPGLVDELLDLARQTDPGVRLSSVYLKFRLRRALGFTATASIARLRRQAASRGAG